MATYFENLTTTRDNLAAKLAAITSDPKPTYTIDGQNVQWRELYDSLTAMLKNVNAEILAAEQSAPFELISEIIP